MKRSQKILIGTGALAAGLAATTVAAYYTAKTLMKIAILLISTDSNIA